MRRAFLVGLVSAGFALCQAERDAAAAGVNAVIDFDYTYEQKHLDDEVDATTSFNQKYEARYETALTTAFDFLGAVRLELQDSWLTNEADTSQVNPTLELAALGTRSAAKITYQEGIGTTGAFHETAETEVYSNSLSAELQVTPLLWPEIRIQYDRRRDYQRQFTDSTTHAFALSLQKDIYGLRLGLDIKKDITDSVLPESKTADTLEWTGKATYQELLYGGTEFEADYQITENQAEERRRGVYVSGTKNYTHQFKTRLRNSFDLLPQLTLALSWEYSFDQDLLVLGYDYKVDNVYDLAVRWDLRPWLKFAGTASRQSSRTVNDVGEGEERSYNDSLKGSLDADLAPWLQLAGTAELTRDNLLSEISGGAVDRTEGRKFEIIAKNRIGSSWDLTVNFTGSETRVDGYLTDRTNDLKGDLKLKLLEFGSQNVTVVSSYQASRSTTWDFGFEGPVDEKQTRDGKIRLDYQFRLLNLLAAKFSHEYGLKVDDTLDETLSYESELQMNEDTRLSVVLAEFIRDLDLEGDIERKATDIEGDTDPMLVEVSYGLQLGWKYEKFALSSTIKFNDKGDSPNDISFNAKLGYAGDSYQISGEYQFDKVYSDTIDESRRLNLKLSYKF